MSGGSVVPGLINPQQAYERGLRGSLRLRIRLIRRRLRAWRIEARLFLQKPLGVIGLVSIVVVTGLTLLQPLLRSTVWDDQIYDPRIGYDTEAGALARPSARHLLGTDYLGRDIFSVLAFSAQTSFAVGLLAAAIGSALATVVGIAAAYYEGAVNVVLMTIADAFILLPPAVVLLIVGLIFDMSWLHVGLIFGVFSGLGSLALLVKSEALSIKAKQYIEAGKVSGGTGWRIIRMHILPNLISLLSVNLMFIITGSVMMEALLAFLKRTQLRQSWGTMIWQALETGSGGTRMSGFDLPTHWHTLLPPVLAITLFCGGFYLVGRTLDDVTNPRLRGR